MTNHKIALAVSLVFAAPFASAADITTGVSASNIFYVAGASAQTPGLGKAVVAMCSGAVSTYVDSGTGTAGVIYKCASGNALSGMSGLPFIISKLDNGSFGGHAPVMNQYALSFPNPALVIDGATPAATYQESNVPAGTLAGTAPLSASVIPQISLSDVSSSLFRARNGSTLVSGTTYRVLADTEFAKITGFGGQGFGVGVSEKLYKLLQADQGLTVGAADGANQPSLSVTQIAGLMNSRNSYMQKLVPNLVKDSNSSIWTTWPGTIKYFKRSSTSGTQASAEAYFLNTGCTDSAKVGGALSVMSSGTFSDTTLNTTTSNNKGVAKTTSVVVVQASDTGTVKNGLELDEYTWGIMSLENAQPANDDTKVTDWKYIKVAGMSPTWRKNAAGTLVADTTQKLNVLDGQYDFAYDSEMITKAATGTARTFAETLAGVLANGNNLSTSTGVYSDPTYATGVKVEGHTNHYTRGNIPCQKPQLTWTEFK